MTDIKKINIYMGVVGQAYVDKETAKKKLEAAKKNVLDVKHIIYLINHDYEQDIILANNSQLYPLTVLPYIGSNDAIAETTRANAVNARDLADQVRTDLDQKLSMVDPSSPAYAALMNLKNDLQKNDFDGNYENGGNVTSANFNITQIDALITELNDILSIAQNLLQENVDYVTECETVYEEAKAVFEAYIPEEAEDQSSKSDRLEAELIARLNVVAAGLETAQATTDAINQTSNEIQTAANEIMGGGGEPGGGDEPQPIDGTYFSYGTEEITADNYTTVNNAQQVTSYPSEVEYTPSSRSYLYILVTADKNVQIIDAALNAPAYSSENTEAISGYKIVSSNSKIGGTVYIRIS